MAGIKNWSTSAASNNAAPPNGWPEGQAPSTVNNTGRQNMADIRSWYEAANFIDLGHTPTYASSASFRLSGDLTSYYTTNRPIQCTDSTALYGLILSSTYSSPNTTITVKLDSSSAALSTSLASISVGLLDPTYAAISAASSKFIQSGTGAVATDLQTRGRKYVNLSDFCTGSGDEATAIQNAITASANKILYIDIDVSTGTELTGISNIQIVGAGGSITNIDASVSSDINIINFTSKNNFSISGVKLIGSNKSFGPSSGSGCGVYIQDCTKWRIEDNNFSLFSAQAILATSSSSNTLSDGYIIGNYVDTGNTSYSGDDISVGSSGTTTRISINDNICLSSNGGGISLSLNASGTGVLNYVNIHRNIIENKDHHGIYTYAGSTEAYTPTHLVITDNIIKSINWIGIYLNGDATHVIINNNNIADVAKSISGSLPWGGIGAVSSNGNGRFLIITNNIVSGYNGYSGINVKGYLKGIISNNEIAGDNTSVVESGGAGIHVVNCSHFRVNNNDITLNGSEGYGVNLTSTDTTVYNLNNISNNKISEASSPAINATYQSLLIISGNHTYNVSSRHIYVDSIVDSIIINNICDTTSYTQQLVIVASNTAARIKISGNRFITASSATSSILISSSVTDVVVEENDFSQISGLTPDQNISDSGTRTQVLNNKFANISLRGTFTCANAASTTVNNANASSFMNVVLYPRNAAAATLMSSVGVYVGTATVGTSFPVATGDASSAAGTEIFDYLIT